MKVSKGLDRVWDEGSARIEQIFKEEFGRELRLGYCLRLRQAIHKVCEEAVNDESSISPGSK